MPARIWLRLAEAFAPATIALAILLAWQADRRDRAQLASQLAAAQQIIAQASTSQKDRDAQLTQTLAQLTAKKQSNLTTAQLLAALPQALHLPEPLTAPSPDPPAANQNVGTRSNRAAPPKGNSPLPDNPLPKTTRASSPNVVVPAADLKPLYDFALDCQACQAKLTATQADLADEKTKSALLTKERDAALRVAKGGSILRRIARAAKWFAIGAAAGAVAAKVTR